MSETTRIAAHYARNLIETNLDPLVTLSSDGKITDANAAAEAAFECAKSELIGSDFAGYFTKPDAAIALYQQVFNTGTVHNHALDIHHPEGQATPVLYNATLYRDDAGVVLGAVAVARDISDLVLIGKDLKMSESHFKALFNEAPLGIAVIDSLTGCLLSANPMYAKISGKTMKELVTIDWMSITHPDDVQKDLDNMALMNSGQIPGYQLEKRYYQPGGAEVWINLTVTPIEVSDKSSPRHLAMIEDITRRKLQYQQIALYEAIVRSSEDAIISKSLTGIITSWNKGAEIIFGYTAEEVIGTPMIKLFPAEKLSEENFILDEIKHKRTITHFESQRLKKDGEWVDVSINVSPILDQASQLVGISKIARDITHQKQLERELIHAKQLAEAASKSKDEFLANMSHEIRTPMNGVLGMLDLLSETELSPLQQNWLGTAHNSAEALLEIINDILDLSKLEADRIDIERVNFNLVELIDDVCALLALRAHDKGLELNCGLPANLVSVWQGDPQGIRQVLTNLIGNAIKFTEHGEVSLGVMLLPESPHLLHFEIRDTGIGISEANQSRLFKSFSQAESSISRRFGGTGLGLFISKKLVELMGGTMGVDSVAGQGSCFWFNLPLKQSEAQPAGAPKYDLSGKRALIVDDNATNRHILSHYLNHWGLTVGEADNSTTALIELQTSASHGSTYDVIVLDRQMPVMDGLTLAKCLAQIPGLASLPIILLSSTNQLELAEYQNTHIVERLLKTVRQTQLFEALVNALQGVAPKKVKAALTKFDRPNYQGKKVLVVEDNKTNQKVIIANLEKFNIVSELAENGQQALATLEEHGYDLIFMDCHMPVLDGYSATRELRLLEASLGLPHQTVIALTANALSDEREKCLVAGMDDYLSKPLVTSQLTALLAKYFDADSPQVVVNDTGVLITGDLRIWDETTTLLHLQDDKTLLLKIISVFLMESATQLNDLSHLYATGDLQALADTAHALKGGAALFYAAPVVECAQRLEDSARTGQAADYQSLIDALDKAATTLINTLQAYAQPQFL